MYTAQGTLLAIVATYITYMYFALQTGFVFNNRASGVAEEYRWFNNRSIFHTEEVDIFQDGQILYNDTTYYSLPKWTDCSEEGAALRDQLKKVVLPWVDQYYEDNNLNASLVFEDLYEKWNTGNENTGHCTFGSGQNQMTMTYISFTGWLRYAGGFSASLSSAIASMVGAPRILQAVGKDGIYPGVAWFEKGFNANNDPWRGYILVFFVAMGFVMVAKLNAIGIIASNFFLAAYALMNLSCFHSEYTKSPGWRPAFKYYNKWVCLFSAVLCVALMFVMDWRYAAGTVACQVLLGSYIYYAKPDANWGSSADALTFNNALKSTQEITDNPEHIKNYRPKLLVLTGNPAHRPSLVDFANIVTKKVSLLVCGHVLREAGPVNLAELKENMQQWLKDHMISGYYSVAQTPDLSAGARSCMTLSGLGKLSPNMVLMGFKNNWKSDLAGLPDWLEVMYSAFDLRLSFALLRCKEGLDFSSHIGSEQQISREVEVGRDDSDGEEETKQAGLAANQAEKPRTRRVSVAVFRGQDGNRLDNNVVEKIQQFQTKKRTGTVDVWWLYDDGGLTLLLPHIIKTRKQFKDCKLRVFSLANKNNQLDMETRNLASMLSRSVSQICSILCSFGF